MTIDLLIFDLDGCLYDEGNGYTDKIHDNIHRFMAERTGAKFDALSTVEEARAVWAPIFKKYNQTKRGLIAEGYVFDSADYDRYIRSGAEKYFAPDPELRSFLKSLPQKKVIFTNAPESSANEILSLLGVADLFEHVYGTEFMENRVCKPEREAFEMILDHMGVHETERPNVCYFEDSYKNLATGQALGFKTVFVQSATLVHEGRSREELSLFDAVVDGKVGNMLREKMPSLWETSADKIVG
mmetsp:Transcript_63047/g.186238  ORF Transcript_63047/g.186238 Transcript_63047/m.186238 type:complete len:242 (-) Transcript_63047:575-1300(-)